MQLLAVQRHSLAIFDQWFCMYVYTVILSTHVDYILSSTYNDTIVCSYQGIEDDLCLNQFNILFAQWLWALALDEA